MELLRLAVQISLAEAAAGLIFWAANPASGRIDWPDASAALHSDAPKKLEALAALYEPEGADAAARDPQRAGRRRRFRLRRDNTRRRLGGSGHALIGLLRPPDATARLGEAVAETPGRIRAETR